MIYIKRKSAVAPISGSIVDTFEIDNRTTNTYSARVIDELVGSGGSISIEYTNVKCSLPQDPEAIKPIAFSISGVFYNADAGMTWIQWCNSDYNTGGWTTSSATSNVIRSGGYSVTNSPSGSYYVVGGEEIEANYKYGSLREK